MPRRNRSTGYQMPKRTRKHQPKRYTIDMSNYGDVAMNRMEPGVIVLAHIQFKDSPDSKTRPCVVSKVNGREVSVHPMYTRDGLGRVEITRLQRRSYIKIDPVIVDRYNIVNIQRDVATPEIRRILGLPDQED